MMGLKLSFRNKLLLFWLGSVTIILVLVGAAFSYLQTTRITSQSLEVIGDSFSVLSIEIEERKNILSTKSRLLAGDENHTNVLNLIDTYQDIDNYLPSVFDPEKAKLAHDLENHAEDLNLDLLAVHDSKSNLASYFIYGHENGSYSGYLSFRDGQPIHFVADRDEGVFVERKIASSFIERASIHHAHVDYKIDLHARQRGILMETFVPIMKPLPDGSGKVIGKLHAAYLFDERIIKGLLSQSGLEVALLLPNGTRFGDLDVPLNMDDFIKAPVLAPQGESTQKFQQIISDGYVLGVTRLPLISGQHAYFIFGKDRTELTSGTTSLEQAALLVFALMIVIIAPAGAYYLNRTFTRPIEGLLSGVEQLRKGTYEKLPGFTGRDELSVLAQAFNSMSKSIHLREKELHESEERFREFANGASDWFWEMGTDLRFTYHSPRYFEITGFLPADKIGTERTQYVASSTLKDDETKWADHLDDLNARRAFKNFEYDFISKMGKTISARISGKPVLDEKGKFLGYRGTGTDITERKLAESTIRESEERLAMVLEGSQQGIWDWNIETGEVLRNDRWAQMLGYSSINEFESNTDAWKDSVHPDDRDAALASINNHLEGRSPIHQLEYRMLTKDGRIKWIRDQAKIVERDSRGRPLRMCGTHIDITERKKAEEALARSEGRFRDFAEASADWLWETDEEHRFSFVSESIVHSATGLKEKDIVGLKRADFGKEDMLRDPDKWKKHLADLDAHRPIKNFQYTIMTPKGSMREFAINCKPVFAADGTFKGYRGVSSDITDRKLAEAQLIQASKLTTLGEVSTGMAHELNQPLNIIHMAAESLQEMANDDDLPADVLEGKLDRILGQTDRASAIINHMRMFGRTDSGELEEVDMNEAVRGAAGMVSEQLRLSEIELINDLPEICRKVTGHQLQLEQVILNLLTNARDAIEARKDGDGKPQQITICIEDDPTSGEVKLSVQDTGGGVPDAVMERIFEPFFTTKEVGQGTGLGLSISYGIITEMGGRIEAANVDGGAKFTITLLAANQALKQARS